MKNTMGMKIFRNTFLLLLILASVTCSSTEDPLSQTVDNSHARNGHGVNADNKAPANKDSNIPKSANSFSIAQNSNRDVISCSEFSFELVRERDSNLVRIYRSEAIVITINLPTGLDVNGFSVNFLKETKKGFLFSVEYGSRFYYEKTFYFDCRNGMFFLTQVRVRSHDQSDPEKTSKDSLLKIQPVIALEQFNIKDYMKEF